MVMLEPCFVLGGEEATIFFTLNSLVMVYREVSELTQKNGGDSHHPICILSETTSRMSSRLSGVKPSIGGRT